MKYRLLLLCCIALLSSCKDEEKSDADEKKVSASGIFCHELTIEGEDALIVLRIGSGSDMVTLSAGTGECSSALGQSCKSIPAGSAVPYDVLDETGTSRVAGTLNLATNVDYGFYLDVDDSGAPVLDTSLVTGDMSCTSMVCDWEMYGSQSCAAADPCGWVGDGICDDLCSDIVSNPFDDTADCDAECGSVADYETCVSCYCVEAETVCEENVDCVDLYYCVAACAEGDTDCISGCGDTYPDGISDLGAWIDCGDENCSEFL